ncbi:PITH domain-containing protein GA19395-like [Artemia franciscana]|uniref:PITH domain-containing protein n=1 Tax=Artemia franciscana TaxID=6661 RepID=A0AA88IDU1_ARTSF|nr:hypothetical protein QYM36_002836 [Artemia franciscana]
MAGHLHSSSCGCDHVETLGVEYSLYSKINMESLECLNESADGSGKLVFKPWDERLDRTKFVQSDVDEELLFNIPFTGNVKLKGIIVIGGERGSHPSKMRLFKNREQMTFDDVQSKADQEFELVEDQSGMLEYPVKVVTFTSVHHLSIHFPSNYGAETTEIYYIGLRGEWTEAHRHGVTICSYETMPSISDHIVDWNSASKPID